MSALTRANLNWWWKLKKGGNSNHTDATAASALWYHWLIAAWYRQMLRVFILLPLCRKVLGYCPRYHTPAPTPPRRQVHFRPRVSADEIIVKSSVAAIWRGGKSMWVWISLAHMKWKTEVLTLNFLYSMTSLCFLYTYLGDKTTSQILTTSKST